MVDLLSILQNVIGWLSDNEALYLNQAASRVQPPNVIVEIGSFQGKSTIALALNSQVPVFAIDPHHEHTDEIGGVFGPADRARFAENIVAAGVQERVCPVNLTSDDVHRAWSTGSHQPRIGLLFVDGAHHHDQVCRDIYGWWYWIIPGGLLCIHDKTWPDIADVIDSLSDIDYLKRLPDCDSMAVYEVVSD